MQAYIDRADAHDPKSQLLAFGLAYFDFARYKANLFTLMLPDASALNTCHEARGKNGKLPIEMLFELMSTITADRDNAASLAEELAVLYWSNVHGLTLLITNHFLPDEQDRAEMRLTQCIDRLLLTLHA